MKIEKENVKRYAVYTFHDKDGIVDECVITFLKELKKVSEYLQVVVCEKILSDDMGRLEAVADKVVHQEDTGASGDRYTRNVEKALYSQFDEIIYCDDVFFGPLHSFETMFSAMKARDVDIWSPVLACAGQFLVIRKCVFENEDMLSRLADIHQPGFNVAETVKKQGFIFESYVDESEFAGCTEDPLRDFPLYMVKDKKCPIVKRDIFKRKYDEVFEKSNGDAARKLMVYLRDSSGYDTAQIWEHLLRTCNMADLKKTMQLNYVLSSRLPKARKHTINKIALTMHIYYEDQAEMCRAYAESMPEGTDVFITVPTEEKKKNAEKVFKDFPYKTEFRVIGNRGRDVGAFLTAVKDVVFDYDLVCKMHDKKVTQVKPMSLGASWAYKCFENMLKNKTYVENIIATFEEEPNLGMLHPPIPHHGPYYPIAGRGEWGPNYQPTKALAEKIGIRADIREDKEPIAPLGAMFWFRPQALKSIFACDWEYEDYPEEPIADDATLLHAIERLYPFCVQEQGYYPAWVMADTFARIELDNWEFLNHEFIKAEMDLLGSHLSFKELTGALAKQKPDQAK